MNKKTLTLRYGVLLCFVGVLFFVLINSYKQTRVKQQLQKEIQGVKLAYKTVLDEHEKLSELIFFNDLLYDKEILNHYMSASKEQSKQAAKLYNYLKQKFYFYKSFGVKNISFYFANNELFLSMNKEVNLKKTVSQKKSLRYVNSTLKEIKSVEVNNNKASFVITQPLFDDDLNHLGAIEFELSLDYIANMVEKKTEQDVFFLYDKRVQAQTPLKDFSSFILNDKYRIENSVHKTLRYKEEIIKSVAQQKQALILKNMNAQQEFATSFTYENSVQSIVFIPLKHALTNEHNIYLMAYSMNDESNIASIVQTNRWLLGLSLLSAFFLIWVAYRFHINHITLKAQHKKYDDLVDAIDKYVVMIETDTDGFITYITQAFCDIAGYSKKELVGRNINVLRHPDMSKKFFENMWYELRHNKRWEGEVKNQDKNGNSYWIKGIILPKYNINNEIIGYISIRVNITDAKQLKKINNLLKEDLSNKLNEIKMRDETLMQKTKIMLVGKIMDSVAHQWKNPVSNITIELANLKAGIQSETLDIEQLKLTHETIENQLKTLSMSLNEFKTFFNQNGDDDKFNVYMALNEAVSLIKDECKLHGIKVELNASKEIYCYGVFNELRQIISNLLQNSVKQLVLNEISDGKITLSIAEEKNEVIVKCEDNAKGDSKEIINQVFGENYDEKSNKDVGINLFIVKLLIQKIGAQLLFENKDNSTVFYIKLVKLDRRKDQRA